MLDLCLATALRRGVTDPVVVPGAQNVVLISGERVLRFPRHDADAERISEIARRHHAAFDAGLAVHPPRSWSPGLVGVAHLELVRCEGIPLPQVLDRPGVDLAVVSESLVAVLAATRLVGPARWPFEQQGWAALWADLPRRARQVADRLPPASLDAWLAAAEDAAVLAAAAPLGLMHGDLQGHNILVGADGRVSAVLDWDSALIGDPAMDTAAMLYDFPAAIRSRVAGAHQWVADDLARCAVYQATWELQAALWEVGERPSPLTRPLPAGTAR